MSAVYSPRWFRVAALKPSLTPHLRLSRQRVRGDTWMLLSVPGAARSVRLNAAAYALAGRLDGRRSVQQLWDAALQRDADAMTQDELIDLLAQLREASLLHFDRAADFDLLLPHLDKLARPKQRASLLAWRVPLADPSRLLDALRPLGSALFSYPALVLWLLSQLMLGVLALQHAPALWAHAQQWLATPRFALLATLLYLPIKLLHELAHGLAVRRWGGSVREAGVTFMLFMPVPFVDASAANGFARRRQRIAVSAAGIACELALAALALPLWLWLDDGMLRDAAFVTLAIAGVSTLLFNANPLQRLDGYYIFCDAMQLPNLAPRSRAWWLDVLCRRLLRLPGSEAMPVARGESFWLAAYAPLAWLMSLAIGTLAVFWLGQLSWALGGIAGTLLGWQLLCKPIGQLLGQLRRAALARQRTARRWRRLCASAAAALLLVLCLPWPQRTLVQGVVWPPEQAQLRADEEGVVAAVLKHDGDAVHAGDVVLLLENAQLNSEWVRQVARVQALESAGCSTRCPRRPRRAARCAPATPVPNSARHRPRCSASNSAPRRCRCGPSAMGGWRCRRRAICPANTCAAAVCSARCSTICRRRCAWRCRRPRRASCATATKPSACAWPAHPRPRTTRSCAATASARCCSCPARRSAPDTAGRCRPTRAINTT